MDDKKLNQSNEPECYEILDNPVFFKSVQETEQCSYEGHLYNQGITMCGLERPNNADIKKCGPECPEYCPVKIVSICTSTSSAIDKIEQTFVISKNGETTTE